jgi:hypothetical protein
VLRSAILCLLLAASTAWVYSDTLRFDFVSYDDPGYVVKNQYVVQGTSRVGLRYALFSTLRKALVHRPETRDLIRHSDSGRSNPFLWGVGGKGCERHGVGANAPFPRLPNSSAHVLNRVFSEWLSHHGSSGMEPLGTSPWPLIEPQRTALS